jgi:hypothetical protein
MIRHTALFKFRDGTAEAQIDALMAALLALKNDIPVIDRTAWGEIFSDRANDHTHVVSFAFLDRAALEIFYGHPAHKQIAETQIKPITASLLVVDYEEQNA